MKFFTQVDTGELPVRISLSDRIMILGSCFADSVGARMETAGFDVCINPFGTLYNPASIYNSIRRLQSGIPFTEADAVPMGAGAGLVCSFSHHTSFACRDTQEFLRNANGKLAEASGFWRDCNKVIITFGTSFVWKANSLLSDNKTEESTIITKKLMADSASFGVVSNCLKRPASEFTRSMLSLSECEAVVEAITRECQGKEIIFTVSPIRHLSDGAHANTLSKSTLLLATAPYCYFPAFEILNDELRDYRFYAEDLVHPSHQAVEFIWEKFRDAAVPDSEFRAIAENEKAARRSAHRPMKK